MLVAKRSLFTNRVPVVVGGGTVEYVNSDGHDYHTDIAHREEGGTPAIVESIRAGLVFQLKAAVGVEEIRRREEDFVTRAIRAWDATPGVEILGSHDAERLSIVSFVVKYDDSSSGRKHHLHHNFVVALLNDLFGIQARGGCSCAGPYGHRLLGIDDETSRAIELAVTGSACEGIKPGSVRVNFNYFIDEETFDYIIEAVRLVASEGAALLPSYTFEPATGLWRHRDADRLTPPMSLREVDYSAGTMSSRIGAAAVPTAISPAISPRRGQSSTRQRPGRTSRSASRSPARSSRTCAGSPIPMKSGRESVRHPARRQAGRHDEPRRGRARPPGARHPQGRSRRHARPDGDRTADARGRQRDAAADLHRRARQGVHRDDPARGATDTDDAEGEVTGTADASGATPRARSTPASRP